MKFSTSWKENIFAGENEKEVVEGLGSGSFVSLTNLSPDFCGCGEVLPGNFFLATYRNWRHV